MRYLIFCGEEYYANGGGYDYLDGFHDRELACNYCDAIIGDLYKIVTDNWEHHFDIEWAHVFDIETREIIHRAGEVPYGAGDEVIERKLVTRKEYNINQRKTS